MAKTIEEKFVVKPGVSGLAISNGVQIQGKLSAPAGVEIGPQRRRG